MSMLSPQSQDSLDLNAPVLDDSTIALLLDASRTKPLLVATRQALRQRVLARIVSEAKATVVAATIKQDKNAVVADPYHFIATKSVVSGSDKSSPTFIDVAQGDGWRRLHDKAQVKLLLDDGVTFSWLLKLAPGGALPPHNHAQGHEECMILEGDLSLNGIVRNAGDYHAALHGSRHHEVQSPSGCIAFLKSPSQNRASLERALVAAQG